MNNPLSSNETFHSYFSVCSKSAYEKWGGLDEKLILRHIFTMGIEPTDGVRGRDGNVHRYALLILSRDEISAELPVLIPEITDGWLHKEDQRWKESGEK